MTKHPPIHVCDYGDSGGGKTRFASTFPKPEIVFCFDPYGKETPYLERGESTDLFSDERSAFTRSVLSRRTGEEIIRIEYYHDTVFTDPEFISVGNPKAGEYRQRVRDMKPDAYHRFLTRMVSFHNEYDHWKTAVLDSGTFLEMAARAWDQHSLNARAEDPRQWWAASTDMLETMFMRRFATFPMNVVCIFHTDKEKSQFHGVGLGSPSAPGRLRSTLASAFGEYYHSFVGKDGQYYVQTQSDGLYSAASQIHAPNPSLNTYRALWGEGA